MPLKPYIIKPYIKKPYNKKPYIKKPYIIIRVRAFYNIGYQNKNKKKITQEKTRQGKRRLNRAEQDNIM